MAKELEVMGGWLTAPDGTAHYVLRGRCLCDAKVKSFGQQMVTDHTKTSTELKGMVSGGKVKGDTTTLEDFGAVAALMQSQGKDEE